jgi:hypothetical protein
VYAVQRASVALFSVGRYYLWWGTQEQLKTPQREAICRRKQPKRPSAVQTAWQCVLKKPPQEFVAVQSHDFRLVVATVPVSKCHGVLGGAEDGAI